jgi:hypothetical protein
MDERHLPDERAHARRQGALCITDGAFGAASLPPGGTQCVQSFVPDPSFSPVARRDSLELRRRELFRIPRSGALDQGPTGGGGMGRRLTTGEAMTIEVLHGRER